MPQHNILWNMCAWDTRKVNTQRATTCHNLMPMSFVYLPCGRCVQRAGTYSGWFVEPRPVQGIPSWDRDQQLTRVCPHFEVNGATIATATKSYCTLYANGNHYFELISHLLSKWACCVYRPPLKTPDMKGTFNSSQIHTNTRLLLYAKYTSRHNCSKLQTHQKMHSTHRSSPANAETRTNRTKPNTKHFQ